MCTSPATQTPSEQAAIAADIDKARSKPKPTQRRHLWELPANAHCPVIGLCLPLSLLRRLVNKGLGGKALAEDYDLHVGAVAECKARSRVSVLLEDALDQRYCVMLHKFKGAHTALALKQLWQAARGGDDMAGAFWAALTHPACDHAQQDALLREVHMLHHQACAAPRTPPAHKLDAVLALAERRAQQLAEKAGELAQARLLLAHARAELVGRDAVIARLDAQLREQGAAMHDLDARVRLQDKLDLLEARERERQARMAQLRGELAAARQQLAARAGELIDDMEGDAQVVAPPVRLDDKTVLCVGGRHRSVASYRGMTEQTGASFAHHDGGLEDSAAMLDASLAAADLVICQTGCISHSAYWRVKNHCKRTGKQCVFVDNPSASSFSFGLQKIAVRVE
ncbi:DUF2325 domain-containing protein [Massilia sp. DWR3-1-1]|uniref:DUF2325 domain-containing protein n=1 Tax=Massilia sp. DWR3-1-1 TaxID=2804559 RepID=UPI003CED7B1D